MERLVLEQHLTDWRDLPVTLQLNLRRQRYPRTITMTVSQIGRVAESLVAEKEPPTEDQVINAEERYDAWTAIRNAFVDVSLKQVSRRNAA